MTTLDILDRLIAFDTVSANSNLPLVGYVEDVLKQAGYRVTRLPSPCGQKAGIYAEIGPEVPGGLLLSAHTDVVPTAGQTWTRPPFEMTRDGDKIFGRGTTDMKGFVASALALATNIQPKTLKRPLAIVLSYDEEIGCVGLQQIQSNFAPLLRKPEICIVGEPTEMQVATGHKGKTAYRAMFHGQAGHSALAPKFQNALHLATDFMAGLRDMQNALAEHGPFDPGYDIPYSTIHVGRLSGGTALNIVPERAQMDFEIRNLASQNMGQMTAELNRLVSACSRTGGRPMAELTAINTYPGLDVDPDLSWVQHLADISGRGLTKVAFGTEAGILSQLGVPTVVCGPGSMAGQGHKADEFIHVDQLAACDRFLGNVLNRTCT